MFENLTLSLIFHYALGPCICIYICIYRNKAHLSSYIYIKLNINERKWTVRSLDWVLACLLFGAKPQSSPESVLTIVAWNVGRKMHCHMAQFFPIYIWNLCFVQNAVVCASDETRQRYMLQFRLFQLSSYLAGVVTVKFWRHLTNMSVKLRIVKKYQNRGKINKEKLGSVSRIPGVNVNISTTRVMNWLLLLLLTG